MMDLKKISAPLWFAAFLGVALQIQLTLFRTDTYPGLRTGLGDALLPFAGLYIIYTLFSKKSAWPVWTLKHALLWLGGLIGIMTIALVNGYVHNGFLSHWAFFNKYLGFIILAAYFLLGGWIATNNKEAIPLFLKIFIFFNIGVLAVSFIEVLIQPFFVHHLWLGMFFWDGFMVNRNAYTVLTLFAMVLIEAIRNDKKIALPWWVPGLFWALIPIFTIYNGSRAGWIAGVIILFALSIRHPIKTCKQIIPFLVIGILIAWPVHKYLSFGEISEDMQFRHLMHLGQIDFNDIDTDADVDVRRSSDMYGGDKKRLIAVEDGTELYKQSNPVIGAGLGVYPEFQEKKRGVFVDIMDFSALWLLVETGLLGALGFGFFFLAAMHRLYKTGVAQYSGFHKGMFYFLIVFAGISFLHEIMYMRFVWFALGLALVTPREDRHEA